MPKFTEGQKVRVLPRATYGVGSSFGPIGSVGDVVVVDRAEPDSQGDIRILTERGLYYISENSVEAVDTPTEQEKTVTYTDGKLYSITRTMRYDRDRNRFFSVCRPLAGHKYVGVSADVLAVDASVKVERLPDPLPTTPGVTVTLNGHLYASTDTMSPCRFIGLTGEDRGKWYSDADLAGATEVKA